MNQISLSSKYVFRSLVLIVIFGYLLSDNLIAQLNYTDFSTTSANRLTFLGDAGIVGNKLRLIRVQTGGERLAAAAWNTNKHRVVDGFVAMFTFRIINPQGKEQGGADGFAFVVQNSSISGSAGIGGGGGSLGYAMDLTATPNVTGIRRSIAIEFDTFKNTEFNDPDKNHIGIHTRDDMENSANESASLQTISLGTSPILRDGADHIVRIEYDGVTSATPHQWRIYLDNLTTPKITVTKNISQIIGVGGTDALVETDAYVGFTAASAFETENHEISNWSFSPRFISLPNFTAPDADTVGTQTVSTAEYHPGADENNFNVNATIDTAVLPDRKTELWAKYYFPNNLNAGPYPIVVLHHGNHNSCGRSSNPRIDDMSDYTTSGQCPVGYTIAPSHRGYDYLANKLASHGYIVVSINSNLGITGSVKPYLQDENLNFPEYTDDISLILARGRLILRHLQKLSEWNAGVATLASSTTLHSSTKTGETGWFGTKIIVGSSPLLVRSLGRMYLKGNSGNHNLQIVRANDNAVIATTSVTMADWNHGQYKYADLTSPVTLAANTTYYIVSQEQKNGDTFSRASVTSSSVATVVRGGIRSFNGIAWKNIGGNPYNFGVDLRYELASTTPTELGVNLKGKIDFKNVGLMGHSRGGEGMRATYELFRETNSPWKERILNPTDSVNPLNIKGIFEIAPTDRFVLDRDFNVTKLLNADGTAWSVLLPACDGDVFNLAGVKPFDRMAEINNESDVKSKSTYYVFGANHNFYNTQWQTTDSFKSAVPPIDPNGCIGTSNNPLFLNPISDGAGGFGTANQRKTASSPFMAFMRANVGNGANPTFNQNFDPKINLPSNVTSVTKVERSYTKSNSINETLVFQDLGFLPLNTNICLQTQIICNESSRLQVLSSNVQLRLDTSPFVSPNTMNHDEDFVAASLSWTSPNPRNFFQMNWNAASADLSSYQNLEFRISSRRDSTFPQQVDSLNSTNVSNFLIQLVMENGEISTAVVLGKYISLNELVGNTNKTFPPPPGGSTPIVRSIGELHPILRTVRISLTEFSNVDLTRVKGVRLIFNDTSKGAINLSNIRFSK